MTVSSDSNRELFAGNGVTVLFSFPHYFFQDADLVVTLADSGGVETTQVLNTDYTVAGAGVLAGGSITMVTPPAVGETLVILRDVAETQEIDYVANDSFPAETHEAGLDRLTMICQQLAEKLARSILLPITSTLSNLTLPTPEAGKTLKWNSGETGLENSTYDPDEQVALATAQAVDAASSASEASTSAANAAASEVLAEEWASKTTGQVASTDYSSKAYAIGGTGVTTLIGAAKEWATATGVAVVAGFYSAKEWAVGTFTRGASGGGSAKDWAIYTGGTVDDSGYSSKYWAADAEYSAGVASAAAAALTAIIVNDLETDVAAVGATEAMLVVNDTQTLTGNLTIPDNITLEVFDGGSIGGAHTLTVNGRFVAGFYQVFDSSITVSFGKFSVGKVYPQWFGAVADGTTDDVVPIQKAINSAYEGSIVHFLPTSASYCITSDHIDVTKPIILEGNGKSSTIYQSTSTDSVFEIRTTDEVYIIGLRLLGVSYASSAASNNAVEAFGADSSNYLSEIHIKDCFIESFRYYGVYLQYVKNFSVENTEIKNIWRAGIMCISCEDGLINRNRISNIIGTGNAYGVALTRTNGASLVTYPRSQRIVVSENIINYVPNWEGLDTHAGADISFVNNTLIDCQRGIIAGSDGQDHAAKRIKISGNIIRRETLGTTAVVYAISADGLVDATSVIDYAEDYTITNNTVVGYGDSSASMAGSLYIHSTARSLIANNIVTDCYGNGILLYHSNVYLNVSCNNVSDVSADAGGNDAGITVYTTLSASVNIIYIHGNLIQAATYPVWIRTTGEDIRQNDNEDF